MDGGNVVTAEMQEVVDRGVSLEEALRLAGRFEPFHLTFPATIDLFIKTHDLLCLVAFERQRQRAQAPLRHRRSDATRERHRYHLR